MACLVVLWAVLCAVSVHWLWLAFPLYFLVFFIVASPGSWVAVMAMALWSALSGWFRQDAHPVPQVVGSLIGAMVAVICWIVLEQLRANVREQQRLVEQVRSAQRQLLAATEQRARGQERERISRDLHDTLAQGLNSIIMLSRSGAARHPELTDELALIEATARDNLAHARAMMRALAGDTDAHPGDTHPTDTDNTGTDPGPVSRQPAPAMPSATPPRDDDALGAAVRRVVHDAQARERVIGSGLSLGFDEEGRSRPVDADLAHGLVMAVRSLMANVVQHAHARRCQVTLTWQDDHIALDVVDDGTGFDPSTASGFGLAALRARLRELDATLEVSSEPGQGCSVAVTAPLTTSHPR